MRRMVVFIWVAVLVFLVIFYLGKSSNTAYFSSGELLPSKITNMFLNNKARILFVGDMMFDRYIRQVMEKEGKDYIFSCGNSALEDFLKNYDLVVGNLEGPITGNPSRSMGSVIGSPDNYIFTFSPETAGFLNKNNIRLVNLGNNHVNNFGSDGVSETKKYLDEAEVDYIDSENIHRVRISGHNITFMSYNEFGSESSEKFSQKIMEESKRGQIVFVYTHWGDEYAPPPERVRKLARLFANAGARMIVGSHPHVIQPSEKIGETPVYYSLGNFIFDQYWNKEVSSGLAVEARIENGKIETLEHRISLQRDGRTCFPD